MESMGHRLRWARDQARLTQEVLSGRARISRPWLTQIENGRGELRVGDALALHEVLAEEVPGLSLEWLLTGRGDRQPKALQEQGIPSGGRRYDVGGAQTDPPALAAPRETATDRRAFTVGSIGAVAWMAASADPIIQAIAHLCSFDGQLAGETVDGFEELVADLGYGYSGIPPQALCAQLQAALPPLTQLIAPAPSSYQARLQSSAGWLTALLASAVYDTGNIMAAKARALVALEYGRRSGDRRLMAFVRYKQTLIARDDGDYAGALRYVERALAVAPVNAAITCRLLGDRASLLARLADRERSLRTLADIERQHDQLPASEIGHGSVQVSEVFMPTALGCAMISLGDLQPAERYNRQVMDHYSRLEGDARRPTRLANAQLRQAEVLLAMGRPDEASGAATAALDTQRMVHGLLLGCGRFDAALSRRYPGLPEAHDFHERYVAMAQSPALTTR